MNLRTLVMILSWTLAAPAAQAEVVVFAAASLKEPIDRIAAEFGDVVVSYGGSGTIARQVSLGAPADVVLLANASWMDVLTDANNVLPVTIADFASNRLVVVGQRPSRPVALTKEQLLNALDGGRMAIGLTEAVPAGIYAKAALQSLDLWETISPHLAQVDNVRGALALVARGQTPLGIVYRTDVHVSPDVVEIAVFPRSSHPPIRYIGGLAIEPNAGAQDFWSFVQGPKGQAILAEAGFLPPWSSEK